MKITISLVLLCFMGRAQSIDSTFSTARAMYAQGNYKAAISQLSRVTFFDTVHKYDTAIFQLLGDMYYRNKDYNKSNENYFMAMQLTRYEDSIKAFRFYRVRNYLLVQNFASALTELDSLQAKKDNNLYNRIHFLYGIAFFGTEDYDSSCNNFKRMLPVADTASKATLDSLFDAVKLEANRKYRAAIVFSAILPGTGQMILGNYKDGLDAFLLTSAFAALTITTSIVYTPIEGLLSAFPWWLRYYRGNLNHVQEQADYKRFHKRSTLYRQVLKTVGAG